LSPSQVTILDTSITQVLPHLDLRSLARQRLFITGGTGFFGIWLLSALRVLNLQGVAIQVTVLSRNPEAFLLRHPHFREQSWLSFLLGDVCDFSIPPQEFDLLLHGATETSMAAHAEPTRMFDNIINGTRQVLDLARKCGVRRVLLISSGAVYGKQPPHQIHQPDDSQSACNPLTASSAYGEGKRVMELMGAMLQQESGIECVTARCFAFCGPGLPLDGHFAIGNFIRDALYREQITVQGDGSSLRSYLYGADLAAWLLYLLLNGEAGMAYNVGSDQALTIKELAERVRDVLSPGKQIEILQAAEASQSSRNCYVPAIDRARALGCMPWTTLDESLKFTANYLMGGFSSVPTFFRGERAVEAQIPNVCQARLV
jgi:dTDP-glucose 4,6-dehydratase